MQISARQEESSVPSQCAPCWSQKERRWLAASAWVVIATAVTTRQVLRSAFHRHFFFSHSINLTVSIYEIDIIRPVFQIREWKEAGVTIKSINSGARLSLCASPGSALGQLGDFGQGILPL